MQGEASRFAEADAEQVRLITARNQGDLMLYVAQHHVIKRASLSRQDQKGLAKLMDEVTNHLSDDTPDMLLTQMDGLEGVLEQIMKKPYIRERGIFQDD